MLLCQFSDPHVVVVPPAGRVDTARHLAAAVAQVNAMAVQPDVLLLTGDLTDNGTAAEYGLAHRKFQGSPSNRTATVDRPLCGRGWPACRVRREASVASCAADGPR